ncbi:transmembrane protein 132D-like [Megalops cyprinoides]|uniref:transmembrane protein 132D-like n=1 Tax=Megalops cyprinoides TaxID=118141 RepID=UPI001864923F|nr:transmembrane protein 132D-like [Megalops cyprinoides]
MDSAELSDIAQSSLLPPVALPISYRVLYADSLFLRDISQNVTGNSSLQTSAKPFVILRASRPPAVSASYGPLSVEGAVPLDLLQSPEPLLPSGGVGLSARIRSHVLARRVFSSAPKVRVLFYAAGRRDREGEGEGGGGGGGGSGGGGGVRDERSCVTVFGFWETQERRAACSLRGDAGFCVAELEPAASWFRPPGGASSRERQDQRQAGSMELYYQARPMREQDGCDPGAALATPVKRLGSMRLFQVPPGAAPISRLRLGGAVVIQTSSKPLKKSDVATFSVSVIGAASLDRFTLRATVRKGLSFSTARPSNSNLWDTTLEPGTGSRLGTISIVCQRKSTATGKRYDGGLLEILQLDFETEEPSSESESQVITWRLEPPGGTKRGDQGIMRVYITQRDYVGLAPIATDPELLNTAVLTGKKVSVGLRVVAVGADGSVTDVSNVTRCRSTDEDALKVSDRCDYVYVNGKETRGRAGVAVNFTYGHLSAQLEMTVWMPRFPLQIDVSDTELSQIKGWRVPVTTVKRASWESEEEEEKRGKGCMLQYQHAQVRVYTHFLAEQRDSQQPPASFLGGDWQVDVTKLVRPFLKVENPRVARLQGGRILSGRSVGVTAIKVLSPLSDSVLAESTVKVLDDKVSITELGVQLVSGLSLSLQLSPGSNRAIVATATTQEVLNRPKQEAVIGCWLQFSDGSVTPLDIYDPSGYTLTVTSLDKGVVSVRSTPLAVVAEGEGQGSLVKVDMGIGEVCQKSKRKSSVAVAHGNLRVAFRPRGIFSGSDYGYGGREPAIEPRTIPPLPAALTDSGRPVLSGRWQSTSITTSLAQDVTSVSTSTRRGSGVGVASTTVGGVSGNVGGVGDMGGVSTSVSEVSSRSVVVSPSVGVASVSVGGVSSSTGRVGKASVNSGVSSPVYDGGVVTVGGAGLGRDYSDVPSQMEVPKWTSAEVESDLVQASRFPSSLEIGMYALLGVLCLAILVFLVNCVSYLMGSRHKKSPTQCQEPGAHRHNWVWLGTEADRGVNGPVVPPPQENHAAIAINIDMAPCAGMVAMGKSATLGRRPSAPPSADPARGRRGSLQSRPMRSDSLHSPTSKRKRVQFTTFSSLDNPHYSTLPGIHWIGKAENCAERHAKLQEALYANLSYDGQALQSGPLP